MKQGKRIARLFWYLAVLFPSLFWAFLLRGELLYRGFGAGDVSFHENLTHLLLTSFREGSLGLDAWYGSCALGAAVFRSYQHWPHFLTAGLALLSGLPASLLLHFLLGMSVAFQGLAFYAAARTLRLSSRVALGAAWLAPLVSSSFYQGHDFISYVFVGRTCLFTQALGIPAFVLALASGARLILFPDPRPPRSSLETGAWLALSFGLHHLLGYFAALSLGALTLFALLLRWTDFRRLWAPALAGAFFLLIHAYQFLAFWQDAGIFRPEEVRESRWDGFGASFVLHQFFSGEFLDSKRLPLFSLLALAGIVAAVRSRARRGERALLFFFFLGSLLLAGRPVFGAWLDWIPGFEDAALERALILAQVAAVFLASLGMVTLGKLVRRYAPRVALLKGVGLGILALSLGYLAWDRACLLRRNQEALEAQKIAEWNLDHRFVEAIATHAKTGYLWAGLIHRGKMTPLLGSLPYYFVAAQLHYPQLSIPFHNMTHGADATFQFDPGRREQYRVFNVAALMITEGTDVPSFLRPELSTQGVSFYSGPTDGAIGMFDVIGVPKVVIVRKTRSYLKTIEKWLHTSEPGRQLYPGIIPETIAARWPSAIPAVSPAVKESDASWGKVLRWEAPDSHSYSASLVAERPGAYGVLRQAFHPRWQVFVGGVRVDAKWVGPDYLAFALKEGVNEVRLSFPPDPVRAFLFLLGLSTLSAIGLGAALLRSKRRAGRRLGLDLEKQVVLAFQ